MTDYALYLESGPRRKKTMVHVLDLLGCVATGPTTEAALEATPEAIRAFLDFLHRHGEPVDPEAPFTITVAEHITEGVWLGNGDPSLVFGPDRLPLTPEDGERFIRRLSWMGEDLAALLAGLAPADLEAKPPKGRPIRQILEHILESEASYMAAFGRLEGLPGPGAIVKRRQGTHLEWLAVIRAAEFARLRALTPAERTEMFIHWKQPRTARKVVRRMLEHQWEHLVEIAARL